MSLSHEKEIKMECYWEFLPCWLALCQLQIEYLETLSTQNPRWPHLSGTQVDESHYPSCPSLWSFCSLPQLGNNLLLGAPPLAPPPFTGDSDTWFRCSSQQDFHSSLWGLFFVLLQPTCTPPTPSESLPVMDRIPLALSQSPSPPIY